MTIALIGDVAWLDHLADRLDGTLLKPLPNNTLTAGTRLERIPDHKADGVFDAYLWPSRFWATTTPATLPRPRRHKSEKTRKLIEKAFMQSGIDQPCKFEWSLFSNLRKMLGARKCVNFDSSKDGKHTINYIRPDHLLNQNAAHRTISFPNEVPGPMTIGAGRHCGFGLMAVMPE